MPSETNAFDCPICGATRDRSRHRPSSTLPSRVKQALRASHPEWDPESGLCDACVMDSKVSSMREMLADDGNLSEPELEVLESIRTDAVVSVEEDVEAEDHRERLVNQIARMIGSWYVFSAVLVFLVVWTLINVVAQPFEPYPVIVFAVTSATLGAVAALEGPIIIMSQRRQRIRDRERASADYKVNLKAELEIQYLDEKVDELLKVTVALRRDVAAMASSVERD